MMNGVCIGSNNIHAEEIFDGTHVANSEDGAELSDKVVDLRGAFGKYKDVVNVNSDNDAVW
jgi:hypothetical protein